MSSSQAAKNGYITTSTIVDLAILGRGRGNNVNTDVFLVSGAGGSPADAGGNAVAITATGAAVNATEPFTSTYNSILFRSGASVDYLTMASNSVFTAGTGDYTAECWVYPTANRTYSPIFETQPAGTAGTRANGFLVWRDASGILTIFCNGITNYTSASNLLPLSTWKHIAISRISGVCRLFVDGALMTTISNNTMANVNITTSVQLIGRLCDQTPSSSNTFAGYISNWRWLKGNGQYFFPFTTPTSDLSTTPTKIDWTRNYGIKSL